MAYFNTNQLAGYIINKYYEEHDCEISPLKLQKTMYLLFAMWGGNARRANKDIEEGITKDSGNGIVEYLKPFDEELFEPNFEAWKYGPVDREVYMKYRNSSLERVSELDIEDSTVRSTIISFIDSICAQTFKINDFALVDLTHKDEAWKSAYDENEEIHSSLMNSEVIISEYENRLSSR